MDTAKRRLRAEAKARRATAAAVAGPGAGDLLAAHLLAHVPLGADAIVAGYWPIRDEIDTLPLMNQLHARGATVALPVLVNGQQTLRFRRWEPGMELAQGPFGTAHPPDTCAEVRPAVVIVPLLAFDPSGHRLGYGGGHYDRTLAHLRATGPVLAVGAAYAAQQVVSLPAHAGDQRLDWVVTEAGALRVPARREE